jgi:peptidoglycan/LPS O-acetylase OafA/YrhL
MSRTENRQVDSSRLLSLDSLRGIAALYVVLFHARWVPHPALPIDNYFLEKAIDFGGTGVFLFFAISGFSLSLTMPRHDRSSTPNVSFGISRIFRIAPCFFFMLLVSIIRDHFTFGGRPSITSMVLSLSFLFNLVPRYQEGIVWASWTIGVEMLFYAAFLPLYRLGVGFQAASTFAALLIFGVLSYFVSPDYLYWSVLGFFPLFVFGMLAFRLYSSLRLSEHAVRLGWIFVMVGISTLALCSMTLLHDKDLILRFPIGSGYSLILLGCTLSNPRFLTIKPLMFYGRISYSLYLVHAPIVYAISAHLPNDLSYVACAALTLLIATPCAFLMYEFVEKPGIRLGANLLQRYVTAVLRRPMIVRD